MNQFLDDIQINRLSEILADVGQVFFASMVIAPFVAGIDKLDPHVVTLGLGMSLGFWISSVSLVKERGNEYY